MIRIRLYVEGAWGRRVHDDDGDEITIGRGREATLRIADEHASRVHARIRRDHDGYLLLDQGSSNGTFVNGVRTPSCRIHSGDVVRIGETDFAVQVRHEPSPDPAADTRSIDGEAADDDGETTQRVEDEPREVRRLRDRLRSRERFIDGLKSLVAINRSLLGERNRDTLWESIVDTAIQLTRADRGFLVLRRDGDLVFETARNFRQEELAAPELEMSRSIARQVAEDGQAVITSNAVEDDRFDAMQSVAKLKLRSVVCVPLRASDRPVGALYVDNRFEEGLFTEDDVFLLESFAEQASLALKNAELFAELGRSRDQIASLNHALEGKVATQEVELAKVRRALASERESARFRYDYDNIVGRSPAMTRVLNTLDRITPTDLAVLIEGESGTGKELIARAIHFNGPRAERAFVSENCAAIPATLFESQLFGYVRGAFTGAEEDREGLLELADGGTLFLDEIGELDPLLQRKLLRVLQEGEVRRLGDSVVRRVDVRVVSATNRELLQLVSERTFREDLYYRLCGIRITLPPLRERLEDVPELVAHFLARLGKGQGERKRVEPEALAILGRYAWPGNVRQLENELRRAWHLADDTIGVDTLSRVVSDAEVATEQAAAPIGPLREAVDQLERRAIEAALARFSGNKSRAAEALGLSRVGLRKKIARLGIEEGT